MATKQTPAVELRYRRGKDIKRTNEPGTCLYCGERLRHHFAYATDARREALGPYADNAFCSMRCGYSFGVVMASCGERLRERVRPRPERGRVATAPGWEIVNEGGAES